MPLEDLFQQYLHNPDAWIAFLTLTVLEIVLGIDNVIFLALVVNRLDRRLQPIARFIGLFLALIMRVIFLASVVWLVRMSQPLFTLGQVFPGAPAEWATFAVSWRDIILLAGGGFLIYKGFGEIADEVMPGVHRARNVKAASAFGWAILQIVALDLVFSIDSVMTAVGLSRDLPIMVAAITIAILVMLLASGPVSRFIDRHPTVKMLALVFILAVGLHLIGHGLHFDIPRTFLYAIIGFSLLVELFRLVMGRRFQDLGERLRHPAARLVGVALLVAVGFLVYKNIKFISHEVYLELALVAFAFQLLLELLNSLARWKRQREHSSA